MSALRRYWNGRGSGLAGAGRELATATWSALLDRLTTWLIRGNLARAGRGVIIQRGVAIRNPGRVELGDRVRIGRGVTMSPERSTGSISIGDDTWIDRNC